jgi:ABC-type nitrate/sulfonate/bicarbonate transport system permease component
VKCRRHALSFLLKTRAIGVTLIVALLVLWEASVRLEWIDSPLWPAFSTVLAALWEQLLHDDLVRNIWRSLERMFIGYAIAALLGVGAGLLMGYSAFFYRLLEPITETLRPIPSPAYIPIAILFLGIGDEMKIFMIALACLFPILLNTYSGVRSVDPVQINTGRTFGLTRQQILWEIVFPASAPYIFTGLRISLAVALILTVISEMVAANDGIGYYILHMQRSFLVAPMYAGIVTLALLGYGLNQIFVLVEHWTLRWYFISTSANDGER